VAATAGIIIFSIIIFDKNQKEHTAHLESQLSAISSLKVNELVQWRKERLADGMVFFGNRNFVELAGRYFESPEDVDARDRLLLWMSNARSAYGYERVYLADAAGERILAEPAEGGLNREHLKKDLLSMSDLGKPAFLDFHFCGNENRPKLAVVVPLAHSGGAAPFGMLVLRIDPEAYLYPMIKTWPTPSETAETLLVRREGNEAVFLNSLRFKEDAALKLRVSLEKKDVPAAMAVLGKKGGMRGTDYRGERVLADVRAVPDSPWRIVAKIDEAEAFAPMAGMKALTAAMAVCLIAAVGAALLLVAWKQKTKTIRERAVAAEALAESEAKYRLLADNTLDMIWKMDTDLKFTYVNPAIQNMFGFTQEEFTGSGLENHCSPEELSKMRTAIENELILGVKSKGVMLETEAFRKDGTVVPVEVRGKFLFDENGTPIAVQGTTRDISERKKADFALRRSESRMRSALRAAPVGIGRVKDRVILEVNEAVCEMTGYSREELLGRVSRMLYPSDEDYGYVGEEKYRQIAESGHGTVETRWKRKDGIIIHIILSSTVIGGEEFDDGTMTFTALDVSNMKEYEERISHLNRVLMAIRDVNQLIVRERSPEELARRTCALMVGSRGYTGAIIILCDESGRPEFIAQEGIGEEFEAIEKELDRGKMPLCCVTASQSAGVNVVEDREKECAGCGLEEDCARSAAMSVRLEHGGVNYGYVAVSLENVGSAPDADELSLFAEMAGDVAFALRNIKTEKDMKRAERERDEIHQQFLASQKMEAVGRLAGGIAHDFNNVLTVINSYSGMVLEALPKGSPCRSDVEEISSAGRRAAELTRQLLAFSRRQVMRMEIVDLNRIVKDMEPMLKRLIGENILLATRIEPEIGRIKADPGQLEQVVMNLAVNARDAMPTGGKLTIETYNVDLDEEYAARHSEVSPGSYVMLSVTDTGCGMSRDTLERVFEPFFTTKEVGKGTGLGLSMVFGIVKQSGGHVWVYSEPGKGTTFKIYFSRDFSGAPAAEPEKAEPADEGEAGGATILVVEDEPGVLNLAKRALESAGYEAIAASSCETAIEIFKAQGERINLLLTDVIMPDIGGKELAEILTGMNPALKVLYMSGYTENSIVHNGELDDGVNFLSKPFMISELIKKTRKALDS
jgi:PAS domain S-box-containing protein